MALFRDKKPDATDVEAVGIGAPTPPADDSSASTEVVMLANQGADEHDNGGGRGRKLRFSMFKTSSGQRRIRSSLKWRRSTQDDETEADQIRISGAVAIVDGARLTVVRIAKNKVVFFAEDECETAQEALHAALGATRRTGRVVWAGDVTVRELAHPPEDLHPRMVELDQAERIARGFDHQRLAAAVNRTALSPSGGGDNEWDEALQSSLSGRKVTITGFAVGSEDGAWLRIGYQHAEMTLVHEGQIQGHRVLGPGVRRARALLRENPLHNPDSVLREMSRELTVEISATLVDWQVDLPVVKVVWAHGPGASTGRLTTHLQHDTKRRFDTPRVAHIDYGEFPQAMAEVPTALYALRSPLLGTPQRTLRKPRRRRRIMQALAGVVVAVVLAATWVYSGMVGEDVDRRIGEARAQQVQVESQADPELEELIGKAQTAQLLMKELADEGSPDWLIALRHFEGRPLQITRTQTTDQVTVACGTGGVVDQLNDLDVVAELIFGEGGYARAGSTISCSPEGEATYQISMSAPEEASP